MIPSNEILLTLTVAIHQSLYVVSIIGSQILLTWKNTETYDAYLLSKYDKQQEKAEQQPEMID